MTLREAINSKKFNSLFHAIVFIDEESIKKILTFDGDYGCIHYSGSITPAIYNKETLILYYGDYECDIKDYESILS